MRTLCSPDITVYRLSWKQPGYYRIRAVVKAAWNSGYRKNVFSLALNPCYYPYYIRFVLFHIWRREIIASPAMHFEKLYWYHWKSHKFFESFFYKSTKISAYLYAGSTILKYFFHSKRTISRLEKFSWNMMCLLFKLKFQWG